MYVTERFAFWFMWAVVLVPPAAVALSGDWKSLPLVSTMAFMIWRSSFLRDPKPTNNATPHDSNPPTGNP